MLALRSPSRVGMGAERRTVQCQSLGRERRSARLPMAGDGEGWITSVAVPTFTAVHAEFERGGLGGIHTERFVMACDTLVTVFERLGMTFQLAAVEVAEKKRHLTQPHVLRESPTVASLIANDLKVRGGWETARRVSTAEE